MLKAAARDRTCTLCWAAVACPVTVVAPVYLRLTATWVAVTLLIVLIYLSNTPGDSPRCSERLRV